MAKTVKSDGTYDGRTKESRQAKGKSIAPKSTERKFAKALKNSQNPGK